MRKFLTAVLALSLLALAILTPLWWLESHPAAVLEAAPEPTPSPSADPAVLRAAKYGEALAAYRSGDPARALLLFEEMDGYADSREQAGTCRETIYSLAMDALFRRELDTAAELLRPLGEYADSGRWLRFCEKRLGSPAPETPLLDPTHVYFWPKRGGTLYFCDDGLFYVPPEINRDTKVVVYYPGGVEAWVDALDSSAICDYLAGYAPNALCFFARSSGFLAISEKNHSVWPVMEQLMQECGIIPHSLYLIGTSNGFYTAMNLAVQLLTEEELSVRALVSLDCGEDWGETKLLLNPEELTMLAGADTKMELFEQRKFDPGRQVIQDMLKAGLDVDLIECYNGNHDKITSNAFRYGAISWVLGEGELTEKEYILKKLN